MTQNGDFFSSPQDHSKVKSAIVSKYFAAWVGIMKSRCKELTYLDLFSGPGVFDDGTPSTPIKVFDVVEAKRNHRTFKSFFYEKDKNLRDKLSGNLSKHSAFGKLNTKPEIPNIEVSKKLIRELPINDCTFSFVDPKGYKISAELLASLVKNWGSDCVFYLSTQGIRRNIESISETDKMSSLFGKDNLEPLRQQLKLASNWHVKDRIIIKELAKRIVSIQMKQFYFLDFAMEFEDREMVSYYLILITHHHRGFAIMKSIMSKESYKDPDGIPLYVYSKTKLMREDQLPLHFGEKMDELKRKLCRDFDKRTADVKSIVEDCHKRGYIHTTENIKDALSALEGAEATIVPPRNKRRVIKGKTTLADHCKVTFHCLRAL